MSIVGHFNRGRNTGPTDTHGRGSRSVYATKVTQEMVVECHKRNPRWSPSDIARSLGASRQSVAYHLRSAGIVLRTATFRNNARQRRDQ